MIVCDDLPWPGPYSYGEVPILNVYSPVNVIMGKDDPVIYWVEVTPKTFQEALVANHLRIFEYAQIKVHNGNTETIFWAKIEDVDPHNTESIRVDFTVGTVSAVLEASWIE